MKASAPRFVLAALAGAAVLLAGQPARCAPPAAPKSVGARAARPNILWLIAEDFGPHLGCYGAKNVSTPNLDRLAAEGVRYTRFYNGNVCSPSRSAFNTGMYATSIDAHNHRSNRQKPLPEGVRVLSDWMRQAGYFTANVRQLPASCGFQGTGKTDWNFKVEGQPFDSARWADLKAHQPFYAQVNFSETHRAFRSPKRTDPAKVEVPPYYPDHPIAREDWARYLDEACELDRKVGRVLEALVADGLDESTVVVFFGDNGQAHVRGKQFCYEEGVLVPLIIRWPKDFPAPARFKPGTVDQRLLHGIDLAPTMLALAGAPKPSKMQGQVFLGDRCEPDRQYVFGHRDRCDMTVMRIRTVRDDRYRYIRNFTSHVPFLAYNAYKEKQYPVWNLLQELHAAGKLAPAQEFLCRPAMPDEELYDLQADPWEIHNLAASDQPEHQAEIKKLRAVLEKWIEDTGDQGRRMETLEELKEDEARFEPDRDWRPPPGAKGAAGSPGAEGGPAARPNVLFIAVDDLNHWVGYTGRNPQAKTPNIDRLSKMGVSFTHAYCAAPLCNPSRAALMSGLRPGSSGCYQNNDNWKSHVPEGLGLSSQFKKAGYYVAGAGKIYHSSTYYPGEWDDYYDEGSFGAEEDGEGAAKGGRGKRGKGPPEAARARTAGIQKLEGFQTPLTHDLKDSDLADWHIVDYCIRQLEKPRDKPFFLACGVHKPHLPWVVPRKYYGMFPLEEIRLPPYREDDLDDLPEAGLRMAAPRKDHAQVLASGRWKAAVQSYLATIAYTDMNIGRLLDALERSPHARNTIVCFWGDHGWHLGEKHHWRKFTLWEEATRAPLIWVAPGVTKPGAVCARTVDFMSIYPTLCELAGLPVPGHVEGASIRALLADPAGAWDGRGLTTFGYMNHAVRTEAWRYIRYRDGGEELYDEKSDPYEWTNLARGAESAGQKAALAKFLPAKNAPAAKPAPGADASGKKGRKKKQAAL